MRENKRRNQKGMKPERERESERKERDIDRDKQEKLRNIEECQGDE